MRIAAPKHATPETAAAPPATAPPATAPPAAATPSTARPSATAPATGPPAAPPAIAPPALLPPTRYQGSKRKLAPWIWSHLRRLDFDTALDAFGGTGAIAYLLKSAGKQVTYNDVLAANAEMAVALIENDRVRLTDRQIARIGRCDRRRRYPTFIADTFPGIYFTDDENAWLDRAATNIRAIPDRHARALAWYAVFQAALSKRPYNLFHRRNLYMRTADVARSFGNKRTWDRSFPDHVQAFAAEANAAVRARAACQGGACRVVCGDVLDVVGRFDLVYLDPPYINGRGVGVDYAHFYHFLDGMLDYDRWPARVDWTSKHRRTRRTPSPWTDPRRIHQALEQACARFAASMLAVSYRSDGIPSVGEIVAILRRFKRRVTVYEHARYQYALSTNRASREVLVLGA